MSCMECDDDLYCNYCWKEGHTEELSDHKAVKRI